MPSALWLLLWMNFRAVARRTGRQARTPRGLALTVVGVAMAILWVLPSVVVGGRHGLPAVDPAATRTVLPVAILGFCLMNVLSSAGDRAVSFSPAEVDFLFPGPFTRRQLLAYKLVKTGLGTLLSAAIFGLVMTRYGGSYPCRVVGIWLTFQFMQGVAMVFSLVQANVGERRFAAGKWWVMAVLLAAAVVSVAPKAWEYRQLKGSELAARLRTSPAGRAILAPFGVFANGIMADRLVPDALGWDAAAATIDAGLIGLVLLLDANYLEAATAASARRYDRLSRVRRAGIAGMAGPGTAKLRVPPLPWLGGAGPVAWRQLTTVVRTSRGLLLVLLIVAVGVGGTVSHADRDPKSVLSLLGVSLWMNLFLTSMLRFDFRGDLDHLDVLRSLPLRPTAVAAAELVAPTVVLSAVQGLLLLAVALFGHTPAAWLVSAAAFVVPINALVVGTENLIFLLFPYRPANAVAGDMGMVGRQSIVFLCRFVVLASAVACAALSAGVGYLLTGGRLVQAGRGTFAMTGGSPTVAAAAGWAPLPIAVAVVVLLLGVVYARFDPTADTPT